MWADDGFYDILGTHFRVQCEAIDIAERTEALLREFRTEARGVRGRHRFALVSGRERQDGLHGLFRDCRLIARSSGWAPLVSAMLAEVNREALEEFDHFAVHAGVVLGSRGVIAFPASSGEGKSTLTAACMRAGLAYVSDEALCVSYDTGSVVAYPKPLALSRWSRDLLEIRPEDGDDQDEAVFVPSELGTVGEGPGLVLSDVVLLDRRPGPSTLEQTHGSEAMAILLRMSFNHYKRPQQAFGLVATLAEQCRAWALSYDDPVAAGALLRQRLG